MKYYKFGSESESESVSIYLMQLIKFIANAFWFYNFSSIIVHSKVRKTSVCTLLAFLFLHLFGLLEFLDHQFIIGVTDIGLVDGKCGGGQNCLKQF